MEEGTETITGLEHLGDTPPLPIPADDDAPLDEAAKPAETQTPTDEGEQGKPGGADPQSVRARQEYQRRVAKERENTELQRQLNILRGEVNVLKEQKETKPAETVYTMVQVNAAVDAGTLSRADADRYIEDIIIPRRLQDTLRKEKEADQKLEPEKRAQNELIEYVKVQPWLNNTGDQRFTQVAVEFNRLQSEYGLPDNWVTKNLAVRNVLGPIERLKERAALRANTRDATDFTAHTPAGGGAPVTNGKIDINAAPKELVAQWDRFNTSPEDRKIEMKYWNDKQAKKKR